MSSDKHYNPAIHRCLQNFVGQRDWQGLLLYTDELSNAQFRTAGYILGERVMPTLGEGDTWELARVLTQHNARAYLITILKAIRSKMVQGEIKLHSTGGRAFLDAIRSNDIDRQKALLELLPVIDVPADIQWLFGKLGVEEGRARMASLLRIPTLSCSFALFHTLRYADHDHALLVRTTLFLMKRGDALGFNLASLLRAYYGLEEVKGTFALHIEPYQLARLGSNYEAFCQAMRR